MLCAGVGRREGDQEDEWRVALSRAVGRGRVPRAGRASSAGLCSDGFCILGTEGGRQGTARGGVGGAWRGGFEGALGILETCLM